MSHSTATILMAKKEQEAFGNALFGTRLGELGDASGPTKGEFIPPPNVHDADEAEDALPEQEEFWRAPVRFGSIPVEKEPLGWDRRRGFRKLYPQVMLPTQVVERVSFGHPSLEPNRPFWGDNLHVMRQLPSESIDLIYIDPPFDTGGDFSFRVRVGDEEVANQPSIIEQKAYLGIERGYLRVYRRAQACAKPCVKLIFGSKQMFKKMFKNFKKKSALKMFRADSEITGIAWIQCFLTLRSEATEYVDRVFSALWDLLQLADEVDRTERFLKRMSDFEFKPEFRKGGIAGGRMLGASSF